MEHLCNLLKEIACYLLFEKSEINGKKMLYYIREHNVWMSK